MKTLPQRAFGNDFEKRGHNKPGDKNQILVQHHFAGLWK